MVAETIRFMSRSEPMVGGRLRNDRKEGCDDGSFNGGGAGFFGPAGARSDLEV
jgi:hypothetical protein